MYIYFFLFHEILESILSTKIGVQTGSNCKTGPEATTEITYVGSPTSQIPRFGLRNSNNLGNFTYTKKNITLDEPWPLSALSNGSSFKRKDCDSFMVCVFQSHNESMFFMNRCFLT